jgi:hypothetical protein
MVKYLLGDKNTVQINCEAYIDFKVYHQEERLIIHLINLNYTGAARGYAEKTLPVGPVKIKIKLPGFSPSTVKLPGSNEEAALSKVDGFVMVKIKKLDIHQLVILE